MFSTAICLGVRQNVALCGNGLSFNIRSLMFGNDDLNAELEREGTQKNIWYTHKHNNDF